MPAPGKRPDEPGAMRSGWRRGALADPDRPGGVCGAWATSWGPAPRPCAAGIRQGFGSVAGDRPGITTEGARRIKELALEVREPGAGARSGGARRCVHGGGV